LDELSVFAEYPRAMNRLLAVALLGRRAVRVPEPSAAVQLPAAKAKRPGRGDLHGRRPALNMQVLMWIKGRVRQRAAILFDEH
jgi:hypothetical protein